MDELPHVVVCISFHRNSLIETRVFGPFTSKEAAQKWSDEHQYTKEAGSLYNQVPLQNPGTGYDCQHNGCIMSR